MSPSMSDSPYDNAFSEQPSPAKNQASGGIRFTRQISISEDISSPAGELLPPPPRTAAATATPAAGAMTAAIAGAAIAAAAAMRAAIAAATAAAIAAATEAATKEPDGFRESFIMYVCCCLRNISFSW
ncbi:hypothetical protein Emag_004480 [Eimeria magna]